MQRENGACWALAGGRLAARGVRDALGRGYGGGCESLGLNPMQRENGACWALAGGRRVAAGGRRASGGGCGGGAKVSNSIPCNVRAVRAGRRRAGTVPRGVVRT